MIHIPTTPVAVAETVPKRSVTFKLQDSHPDPRVSTALILKKRTLKNATFNFMGFFSNEEH
jgi:hypothetical protein